MKKAICHFTNIADGVYTQMFAPMQGKESVRHRESFHVATNEVSLDIFSENKQWMRYSVGVERARAHTISATQVEIRSELN